MRRVAPALILWLLTALALAGWQATRSAAAGRSGSAKSPARATARTSQPPASVKSSSSTKTGKSAASRRTTRRPTKSRGTTVRARTQQAPTPDRYAEIQRALIERGYLAGPATGNWGPESVEALKRFQQDHNLEATGKINALTLIALGLGPNRASQAASTPPALLNGQNAAEKP